jgi:hypothetical protein
MSSFASFSAIAALIVVFWLVFAIIGLHVFGGLPMPDYPYPNYDTLLNSLVSTLAVGFRV